MTESYASNFILIHVEKGLPTVEISTLSLYIPRRITVIFSQVD
jgi:hypothetical protein